MAKDDDCDPSAQPRLEKAAMRDRRAAALRANLKRRKAQLRGRAAGEAAPDTAAAETGEPQA